MRWTLSYFLTSHPQLVKMLSDVSQSSMFPFPGLHVGDLLDWPHAARKTYEVHWCSWWWNWSKLIRLMHILNNNKLLCSQLERPKKKRIGVSFHCLCINRKDRPQGYLPSQLWILPVIYLILMFTLQWCGLRDTKTGDERMRDRETRIVMAVCGRSQECEESCGWMDWAGRKLQHAWQAASEPLTHPEVWALTQVDTTGCNTARISNTVNRVIQAELSERHCNVFQKVISRIKKNNN